MNKYLIILLVLNLFILNIKSDDKCRVLVLEGGGDKGSYHAGAFKSFVEYLDPQDIQYDVVSGISVGGINAVGISFFEKGQEKGASDYLINWWSTVKRENVWQPWPLFTDVLFHKQGLLDTTPLRNYLNNIATTNTVKRNFTIGTTDLNKGELLRLRNEDVPTNEDKVNMLMATSAVPALFPHIQWRNTTFADGGTIKNLDVDGGINWCKDQGFQENQIIVDAILCTSVLLSPEQDHSNDNTVQQAQRAIDVFGHALTTSDIQAAMTDFPEVEFRYIVNPGLSLKDFMLEFNQQNIKEMIAQGQEDAKNVINKDFQ